MQHLITVCGYIFITMISVVASFVLIAEVNYRWRKRKERKTKEKMDRIREAAEEAALERAGEALLTYVKSHLEFLDNQRISKN